MSVTTFMSWVGVKSRAWIAQPGKSAVATAILGVVIGSAWRVVILRYAGPSSASASPAAINPANADRPARATEDVRESRPAAPSRPEAAPSRQMISDTGL